MDIISFYACDPELFDFEIFHFSLRETMEETTKKENQKVKMQLWFPMQKNGKLTDGA